MKIILVVLFCYGVLVIGMFLFQRSFMYFPDITRADPVDGIDVVTVSTNDGLAVSSWFVGAYAHTDQVIVFFHGNAGNAAHRIHKAAQYVQAGYSVMLAEYRGFGGNDGQPSEQGVYQDARAQIDYLIKEKGYREDQIILYGESIGSGVAVQMATEYPNAYALILETPFSSMVDVAAKSYPFLPVRYLLLDRYMSSEKISAVTMPVFIGHGKNDEVVPYVSARNLYDQVKSLKTFVDYDLGNHNNLYQFGFGVDVLSFLSGIKRDNQDNSTIEILSEE